MKISLNQEFLEISDRMDHKRLIQKLEKYVIKQQHLDWLKLCKLLEHYVRYSEGTTDLEEIKCGVPQGPILGLLFSLIFANHLQHVIKFLDPIMFANDTNLIYSNTNAENINKQLAINASKTLMQDFFEKKLIL